MKNSKKSVLHVLSMSILLAWSSTSFAELVNNNSVSP
ncbi:MAG: D-alanyl-D-alanine endopeptidase, partial [Acinetobacter junii]|nr:D-alanyl-D-alanine endopeptidase [Acinetobacter junii]